MVLISFLLLFRCNVLKAVNFTEILVGVNRLPTIG